MLRRVRDAAAARPTSAGFRCLVVVVVALVVFVLAVPAEAQVPTKRPSVKRRNAGAGGEVLFEPSPPVANLFARAEEGIARREWKFAIDSLQRIIEYPEDSLLPRSEGAPPGGTLYESARRQAMRRVATLPPEGLAAYRLYYDGKAKRLFEFARDNIDPQSAQQVVQRFMLTRYGDEAADLLASWALDEGRPADALAFLKTISELVPDYDVPEAMIVGKRATAYALLGRIREARAAVHEFNRTAAQGDKLPDAFSGSGLAELASWSDMGTSPEEDEKTFALNLSLSEPTPWRFELPNMGDTVWSGLVAAGRSSTSISGSLEGRRAVLKSVTMPVGQAVSDGTRVFVRTTFGCAALNADDLSPVWVWPQAGSDTAIRVYQEREGPPAPQPHGGATSGLSGAEARELLYKDYVGGGIALGEDLVLTVTTAYVDSLLSGRNRTPTNQRRRAANAHRARSRIPMSLRAFDTRSGELRWALGLPDDGQGQGQGQGPGQGQDSLRDVAFRGLPIEAEGVWWVPIARRNELAAVALNPADGSVIRTIPLCLTNRKDDRASWSVMPGVGDGAVFFPTSEGLLFAVDAGSLNPRWAVRYAKQPNRNADQWLPSRPVVAAGTVVLAPPDHDALFAFATSDGSFFWSVEVPQGSYLIAAEGKRLWVGGSKLTCLSIIDGQEQWSTALPSTPTGRAVLANQTIYAAMLGGVTTVSARDGKVLATWPRPALEPPLGNLYSTDTAVISVDPDSVRRCPDLDRDYPAARRLYEKNPSDRRVALRLGWLELLRGEPLKAEAILSAATETQPAGELGDRIAGARVEALIRLAGLPGTSESQALALLEQARKLATSAADRLRCGLAVADELAARDHLVEAYRLLWDQGLSADGDGFVSLAPGFDVGARLVLSQRMARLASEMTPRDTEGVAAETLKTIQALVVDAPGAVDEQERKRAARTLRAVADLRAVGSSRLLALETLAEDDLAAQRFEPAEQRWRRGVALAASREESLPSLMHLCELYLNPALDLYGRGFDCLADLESNYGSMPVPSAMAARGASHGGKSRVGTVASWVAMRRARYRASIPNSSVAGNGPLVLSENIHTIGQGESIERPRLIRFDDGAPVAALDRMLVYERKVNKVHCFGVEAAANGEIGRALWEATLRLPEEFEEDANTRSATMVPVLRRAVSDGLTVVSTGPSGLFALGMATGKRLWAVPFVPPTGGRARMSDRLLTVSDGLLVAMPRAGRVTAMRMVDGSTVWQRRVWRERIAHLWVAGDRNSSGERRSEGVVLAVGAALDRVLSFGLSDGRVIGRLGFVQPSPKSRLVDLVLVKDVDGGSTLLCGPDTDDEGDAVVAYNVSTGALVWRTHVTGSLTQLFSPVRGWGRTQARGGVRGRSGEPEFVGVGLLGGTVMLLDPATGTVVVVHHVASAEAHPVTDGILFGGVLVVEHMGVGRESQRPNLTGLDLATGEAIWQREDIALVSRWDAGSSNRGPGRPVHRLRIVGEAIPILLEQKGEQTQAGRAARRNKRKPLLLAMIDPRTGDNVGPAVEILTAKGIPSLNGDWGVWPGALVIGSSDGPLLIPLEARCDTSGLDS